MIKVPIISEDNQDTSIVFIKRIKNNTGYDSDFETKASHTYSSKTPLSQQSLMEINNTDGRFILLLNSVAIHSTRENMAGDYTNGGNEHAWETEILI